MWPSGNRALDSGSSRPGFQSRLGDGVTVLPVSFLGLRLMGLVSSPLNETENRSHVYERHVHIKDLRRGGGGGGTCDILQQFRAMALINKKG